MNKTQHKIAKTSKIVAIILKICFILIALAMVLLLFGMGVLTFANSNVSSSLQDALTFSAKGTSATGIAIHNIITVLGLYLLQLVVAFMVFFTLHRIFSAISKEHTPFTTINAKRINHVVLLIVAMGFVTSITDFFAYRLMLTPDSYDIDFTWLVMAAVIYCIAQIFDYGCQLQQQSDETL